MSGRAFSGMVAPEAYRDLERVRRALDRFGPESADMLDSAGAYQLTAAWAQELGRRAGYSQQQRTIVARAPDASTHVAFTSGGSAGFAMSVQTGGTGKLGFLTRSFEFGSLPQFRNAYGKEYWAHGPGRYHWVQRRTKRQIPPRSQTGWIAYPAISRWSSRAFHMVLEVVVKTAHDAAEMRLR